MGAWRIPNLVLKFAELHGFNIVTLFTIMSFESYRTGTRMIILQIHAGPTINTRVAWTLVNVLNKIKNKNTHKIMTHNNIIIWGRLHKVISSITILVICTVTSHFTYLWTTIDLQLKSILALSEFGRMSSVLANRKANTIPYHRRFIFPLQCK